MKRVNIGIIGTGWCGGIRARTCSDSAYVNALHVAETNADRLKEMVELYKPKTASDDYETLLRIKEIDAVIVSCTPESTHYPVAKASLLAGKHVLLEKPISIELEEAEGLISIANEKKLFFTIGYSQRFSPKYAYVKQCVEDGTIGKPVSVLVSRHITRGLGKKITGRTKLSPAAMESTHDIDFVLWCLEPAKPVRVYSQVNYGVMRETTGADIPDLQWTVVTMDNGLSFVVGGGWSLPPGYPNFSSTWIEMIGTDGALMVDDTHRDVVLNTTKTGMQLPLSTMPGEKVGLVYAGAMEAETNHFLECVAHGRRPLVTAEQALTVMKIYQAADLSAELNRPVDL